MKIWITQYALNYGIREGETETTQPELDQGSIAAFVPGFFDKYFGAGTWHTSRETAVEAAKAMVAKEIQRLQSIRF